MTSTFHLQSHPPSLHSDIHIPFTVTPIFPSQSHPPCLHSDIHVPVSCHLHSGTQSDSFLDTSLSAYTFEDTTDMHACTITSGCSCWGRADHATKQASIPWPSNRPALILFNCRFCCNKCNFVSKVIVTWFLQGGGQFSLLPNGKEDVSLHANYHDWTCNTFQASL